MLIAGLSTAAFLTLICWSTLFSFVLLQLILNNSNIINTPPQNNQERHLFETLGSSGVRLSALAVALDLRALAVLL